MTIVNIRPKGYGLAIAKTEKRFSGLFGTQTIDKRHYVLMEELQHCPKLQGSYEAVLDKKIEFQLKEISGSPGIYQLYQGSNEEFTPELAFDMLDAVYKAKKGKDSLIERVESMRVYCPPIETGGYEYMNTGTFADMVRNLRTISYQDKNDMRNLTLLKLRIESGDEKLLGTIIAKHDHKALGEFERVSDYSKFDNGRILIGYDSWAKESEKLTFIVVKERTERTARTLEPMTRRDWLCLQSVARIIDSENEPGRNPKYQIRDFDAKFRV